MPYSAIDQSNKYWTAGEEVTTLDAEQTNTEQRVRTLGFSKQRVFRFGDEETAFA